MAGIEKLHRHLTLNIERLVVRHADKATHALLCLGLGIDRFYRLLAQRLTLFVEHRHIRHLDAARIGEHDGAKVARGWSAEHCAAKAQLIDIGDEPRMVDMGMRENQVVDFLGVESKVAVHGVGLKTLALVHTTVEQYFQTFLGRDEVFATCHLTRRS